MREHPLGSACREQLANAHAELVAAARQFALTPNAGSLAVLNGVWARAWRVLEQCGRYTPTPPGKPGAPEKPKEAKVA